MAMLDDYCRGLLDRYADTPLLVPPAAPALTRDLRDGYLPMLVSYTQEDKDAKGLRSLADPAAARPVVHFTVLEMVGAQDAVMLLGSPGSGKTSAALDLVLNLAGDWMGDVVFGLPKMRRQVPRNESGLVLEDSWPRGRRVPVYLPVSVPATLRELIAAQAPGVQALLDAPDHPPLLLVVDAADRLGAHGPTLLAELLALTRGHAVSALVLGRTEPCAAWPLAEAFPVFRLQPLLLSQRRAFDPAAAVGGPQRTDMFMLATALGADPQPDHVLVDRWLQAFMPGQVDALAAWGFARQCGVSDALPVPLAARLGRIATAPLLETTLLPQLVARQLQTMKLDAVMALFIAAPAAWTEAVRSLGDRLGEPRLALLAALAQAGPLGAILAADMAVAHGGAEQHWPAIKTALLALIASGSLTAAQRDVAGRHLARAGDPRDLQQMIALPPARFTMGALEPANSRPMHQVTVEGFAIGRYPVTNQAYAFFIDRSGLGWRSADGRAPARSNAPATDLTWHDAQAYCRWLTRQWRDAGRILPTQQVRLPSEAEWEYAARGLQPDADETVYPWGGAWALDHANSSEAGFNDTCAVGLFPSGRSAAGLDDLTGQVWEWTTTLWGSDMAQPSWTYPYTAADGREAAIAAPPLRRVLRGGCFSSGRQKACCTYRGSLEPDGFWRGNGFRIVVS